MKARLTGVGLILVALVTIGIAGSRIEHSGHSQATAATSPGPAWASDVLADTTEQQTDLDNLDADAQLPDAKAVAADCLAIQNNLTAWEADEAPIDDASIRASYTNTILQMQQAIGAGSKDLTSVTNHVTSAQTFLNATVQAIQLQGWDG
jgi:hypothetical protein